MLSNMESVVRAHLEQQFGQRPNVFRIMVQRHDQNRTTTSNKLLRPSQHLHLGALHIKLDEIDWHAGQQLIQRNRCN
ncbi:hypothetical protein D3C79_729070 [compost metagenome]